jgi:hypothetical protein
LFVPFAAGPACAQLLSAGNHTAGSPASGAPLPKSTTKARPRNANAELESYNEKVVQMEILASLDELRKQVSEQSRIIEEQQAALREQERRMKEIERQLEESKSANATASGSASVPQEQKPVTSVEFKLLESQVEAMADSANETQQRVSKVSTDLAAAQRNYDGKFRQLGNFRFSGDLRYRYEPFIQDGQTARQRQRIRARFNLQGNISATLYGGVTFATGSLDDPISTNQTLGATTGFFNRKQVGFDRAWVQWTPTKAVKGHVTFGLGKFSYPWIRTPLSFDNDLNPEGLYTRLNWDFKNPVFKGISLVAFHLPFVERGGSTSATTGVRADGYDAFIVGGQIQTRWKFGDRINFATNLAAVNFRNADLIAAAHINNGQVTGNLPNTNCVRTNASGAVVGYCSRFLYLDWITTMGINTAYAKWPINLTFDFLNNTRATRIIQIGTAAPTGTAHNNERTAYMAEITLGRMSEQKDVQFGYSFFRIERDALITAFNESDLRAGSNLLQNRFNLSYRWFSNVTLSYTLWVGHVVNANDPFTGTGGAIALVPGGKRAIAGGSCNVSPFDGCKDNSLKRMQLDFIYSF